MEKEKKKMNRGTRITLLAMLLLLLAGGGIATSLAFFHSSASKDLTVKAGSLKIEVDATYSLNGNTVSKVENFNPGDVLVANINVTNSGNKSAWSKATTTIETEAPDLDGFLIVYSGNKDASYCYANKNAGTALADGSLTFANNPIVLSGDSSKEEAEIETAKEEANYKVLDVNTCLYEITIYFDKDATDEAQEATFNLSFLAEAVQYRNNSSDIPTSWN
jgi:predicted ribosomally synthesized peptide with SipW-like signal peptide